MTHLNSGEKILKMFSKRSTLIKDLKNIKKSKQDQFGSKEDKEIEMTAK